MYVWGCLGALIEIEMKTEGGEGVNYALDYRNGRLIFKCFIAKRK